MSEFGPSTDLDTLLAWIWTELAAGAEVGRHAFHTPALATSADGLPSVRTVVLRHADPDERLLTCHTDVRSPKVEALRNTPGVQWHFYDRERKTQLRLRGVASLHHQDEIARQRWSASPDRSRACYHARSGPGAPVDAHPVPEDLDDGFANFVVVRSVVDSIDWLLLRGKGHLRAHYAWQAGVWQGERIAP